MKQNRMYDEFAYLWPLISPPKEYTEEARYWKKALRDKLGHGKHKILELGVGGGHNISHFKNEFKATAVDLSEKMLQNSISLNPDIEHHVGDMRSFRLNQKFKAVLIHDAITYMLTEEDLKSTFKTAAFHLEPGGVLVTAPDYFSETLQCPRVEHSTHANEETELTYVEYLYDPDPSDTTVEMIMHYFIRENDNLRIEQDHHIHGLFPKSTWIRLLEECGFQVEEYPYIFDKSSKQSCLFVGTYRGT